MAGKVTKYLVSNFFGQRLGNPWRLTGFFPAGAAVHSSTCFGEERLEDLFENVFVCSENWAKIL